MKKSFRVLIAAMIAVALIAAIPSCSGQAGKGEAYGLISDGAVVLVAAETDGSGKITSVRVDEMETPYVWAKAANVEEGLSEEDLVAANGYAKRIQIGERIFSAVAESGTDYPDYRLSGANDGVSLSDWLRDGNNAKWYVEQMKMGNFWFITAAGKKEATFTTAPTGKLLKGERWLRSKNGSGSSDDEKSDWKKNVAALEKFVAENGFAKTGFTMRGADGEWRVSDKSTGVYLPQFNDYMIFIKLAVADAAS